MNSSMRSWATQDTGLKNAVLVSAILSPSQTLEPVMKLNASRWLPLLLGSALFLPVHATVVTVETTFGTFEIDLFEDDAPETVENFLRYVEAGDFENLIVHRSVSRFVIQSGGYTVGPGDRQPRRVTSKGAIDNEAGRSNKRGTIAMALLGNDPDSATSEWYINIIDNRQLDIGDFTVFGEVLGDGMRVVDAINNQRVHDYGTDSAFDEMPLVDYIGGSLQFDNVISVTVTAGPRPFAFNRGVSGSWFNVDTDGQGWLFDVIVNEAGEQSLFVAWFTYDANEPPAMEPSGLGSTQHRWFVASGPIQGNVAELEILESTGGVFNDPRATALAPVGTMIVELYDCATGRLAFDFAADDALDDEVSIVRLGPDDLCRSLARQPVD